MPAGLFISIRPTDNPKVVRNCFLAFQTTFVCFYGAGLAEEVAHACGQTLGECAHGFIGGFFGFFRSGVDGG